MLQWNGNQLAHQPRWIGKLPPAVVTMSLLGILAAPGYAQDSNYRSQGGLQGKTIFLPAGTAFEGRIEETIGSSSSRQGQRFTIVTASPVLGNGTDIIIPVGSRFVGEVVEAIPAGRVPHAKGYKPYGKLRVQITNLQMPDGMTYPLVGSLMPEEYSQGGQRKRANPNLGGGVGYAGSQAGFAAVAPGANRRSGGNRGPQLVTKQDLLRDPLYGKDQTQQQNNSGGERIRSLVPKGHELFIFNGSPLSVRLDAPLKIGISNAPGAESTYQAATEQSNNQGGRRFAREAPPATPPPAQEGALPPSQESPGGLPFLQAPLAPPNGQPSTGPLPAPGADGNGPLPAPNTAPMPQPSNAASPPPPVQQPQTQGAPGSSF